MDCFTDTADPALKAMLVAGLDVWNGFTQHGSVDRFLDSVLACTLAAENVDQLYSAKLQNCLIAAEMLIHQRT